MKDDTDNTSVIVQDGISDIELTGDIGEFILKDSVVNINLNTKNGRKSASDQFHQYRRDLRSLRTKPGKSTVKELDAMIVDLNEMAQSFLQIGSNSIAAQYMALMARGQFMRGKVDNMWDTVETALSLDPHCEFALLHLGEFHSNIAKRLSNSDAAKIDWQKASHYLRTCREYAASDGAKNNAGFQLCQALIALEEKEEASEVKQWLQSRVTNVDRRKQIDSLPV
jgi:hypothetical protein